MTHNKYLFSKYVYPSRWSSYWHQIDEVLNTKPENVLVIGVGDKIVVNILKDYVKEVKTLDIDNSLNPDILASVEKIPLNENSVDTGLCAEVLEHLPFEKFDACLRELNRLSKKNVILSLPHFGPPVKFLLKIPLFPEIKFAIKIPFMIKHKFNGENYWEIGKKGYSSSKIRKIIKKYFKINKEFIPFNNQYHHFYILEKI